MVPADLEDWGPRTYSALTRLDRLGNSVISLVDSIPETPFVADCWEVLSKTLHR